MQSLQDFPVGFSHFPNVPHRLGKPYFTLRKDARRATARWPLFSAGVSFNDGFLRMVFP
jgi:hypothetical protein